MTALDYALRQHGLPSLTLCEHILGRPVSMRVYEDSQALIRVVKSGQNPTMHHLHRTHRISVAWLHEVFQCRNAVLAYEVSAKMAADIYTKAFTDAAKWEAACSLVVIDPKHLN